MKKFHFVHRPKSEYAYAFDHETLHLKLEMSCQPEGDVFVIYGDPFLWVKENNQSKWVYEEVRMQLRYVYDDTYVYFVSLKPKYLRLKYTFLVKDGIKIFNYGPRGVQLSSQDKIYDLSNCFNYPYLSFEDIHQIPSWAKERIWYQIFVDRFFAPDKNIDLKRPFFNHQHMGGTLRGIKEKLDDLIRLGVNAIYLTPIFESPSAHKYDTTDYFKIDPRFGTTDDLKELVKQAHQRDIKVMLDGVFNHAGFFHSYFQDVILHGAESKFQSCFHINEYPVINFPLNEQGKPIDYKHIPLRYQTFSFQPYMPKWNTFSKITQDYLLSVVTYWMKTCDIDGWRLDVSNELSHVFLRKIREAAKGVNPDVFILGENWDDGTPWLMGDQVDSVMNYKQSYALWDYLTGQIDGKQLTHVVIDFEAHIPDHVLDVMFNLLGSHDTVRLSHRLNHDIKCMKQAFLLLFFLKGTPMIYYGDEIGLDGGEDPDNRKPMLWDESLLQMDLYQFVKKLIHNKKTYSKLFSADLIPVENDPLVWMKKTQYETLLILINQKIAKNYHVPTQIEGDYQNLIDDTIVHFHDTIELDTKAIYLLYKEDTHEANHS